MRGIPLKLEVGCTPNIEGTPKIRVNIIKPAMQTFDRAITEL